jgi:hypothetical protein
MFPRLQRASRLSAATLWAMVIDDGELNQGWSGCRPQGCYSNERAGLSGSDAFMEHGNRASHPERKRMLNFAIIYPQFLGMKSGRTHPIHHAQHSVPVVVPKHLQKALLRAFPVRYCMMQCFLSFFREAVDAFCVAVSSPDLNIAFPSKSTETSRECLDRYGMVPCELTLGNLSGLIDGLQRNKLCRFEAGGRQHKIVKLSDSSIRCTQCCAGRLFNVGRRSYENVFYGHDRASTYCSGSGPYRASMNVGTQNPSHSIDPELFVDYGAKRN